MTVDLVVLKQSASEVLVWKPAGIASEMSYDTLGNTMKAIVAKHFDCAMPKLPHRLDRVTSGVLVVCLSDEAVAFQGAEIKARRWEKYYLARVVAPAKRTTALFLGEKKAFLSDSGGRARIVKSGGNPARMEIIAAMPTPDRADRWHLVIRLFTGRFHQIRVMCESLGIPLAGDPIYDPGVQAGERDESEFYLEHIVLKYTDFDTRSPMTIYRRDCPERDLLSPEIQAVIEDLAKRERKPE